MVIQYFILSAVLLGSVIYAGWRIKKALSVKSGNPCYGCALKDACLKYKKKDYCKDKVEEHTLQ